MRAWRMSPYLDQMFRFAKEHAYQFIDAEINVMFFWSHIRAHDFETIPYSRPHVKRGFAIPR